MNHLRRHFAKYNYFSVSLNFYSHNVCKSSVCVLGRGVLIYRDRSVNKIRYKELKELGWKRTNRIQHERFVMSEAFENDDNGDLKQMRELVYGKFSFRRIIKQQRFCYQISRISSIKFADMCGYCVYVKIKMSQGFHNETVPVLD